MKRPVSRMTILAPYVPYPPVHGGCVDIWRRIRLLKAKNVKIQYLCWSNEAVSADALRTILSYCDEFIRYPVPETVSTRMRQVRYLVRYPLLPVTYLTALPFAVPKQAVQQFEPDILWLDGYPAGIIAMKMAREMQKCLIYRSHNVEHRYRAQLNASDAKASFKQRLRFFLEGVNLYRFEKTLIAKSEHVFDISLKDMAWWQAHVPTANISWLPPLASCDGEAGGPLPEKTEYDFAFIGNLYTRNNIAAIKWLLENVMPMVWQVLPDARLLIAGSNPAEEVQELLKRYGQVTLIANPPDTVSIYAEAAVLLNPAQSGSGVNLKSVEMLESARPSVFTSQALAGFNKAIRSVLVAHDAPQAFAEMMITYRGTPDAYPRETVAAYLKTYFCLGPERVVQRWLEGEV